jgi:hypothetical protein
MSKHDDAGIFAVSDVTGKVKNLVIHGLHHFSDSGWAIHYY